MTIFVAGCRLRWKPLHDGYWRHSTKSPPGGLALVLEKQSQELDTLVQLDMNILFQYFSPYLFIFQYFTCKNQLFQYLSRFQTVCKHITVASFIVLFRCSQYSQNVFNQDSICSKSYVYVISQYQCSFVSSITLFFYILLRFQLICNVYTSIYCYFHMQICYCIYSECFQIVDLE